MDDALQPFSPRALYVVGHHTTFVGGFFQQVLLVGQLTAHPDAAVAAQRERLFRALKEELPQVSGLVVLADTLARAHGVDLPPPPRTPEAWEPWKAAMFRGLRARLDLTDPASAPFPFGWEHGLARATLAGLVALCDLAAAGLDRAAPLEAGLQDLKALAARWPASAQLTGARLASRELALTFGIVHQELDRLTRAHLAPGDAAAVDAFRQAAVRVSRALRELEGVAWRLLPSDRDPASRAGSR